MSAPAARTLLAALLLAPAAQAQPAAPSQPPAAAHPRPASTTQPAANSPAAPAAPSHSASSAAPHPSAPHGAAPAVRPHAGAAPRHPAQAAKPPPPAAPPAAEPEKPAEPQKGSNTGLPLPRFAALRSNEVNFRSGPGTRYPIEWVYKRVDLPVQVEREFEVWRLVRDQEGVKGWVNQATLAPRRTASVLPPATGGEQVLRRDAKEDAGPVARLKPGVIVRLRSCDANSPWCQVGVGDYRGYMKRTELWGVTPDEVIQ